MKKLIGILFIIFTFFLGGTGLALDLDLDSNLAVDIEFGGTNASTAAQARTNLGLGTGDSPVFTAIDTGQGANELYDMDQNMLTTSSPTFVTTKNTGLADGYIPVHTSDAVGFADSPLSTSGGNVASSGSFTVGTNAAGKNLTVNATLGAELAPALTEGNWTVGAGWESPIVGPGLIKNADGTGTQTPSAATTIVAGTTYKVVITLSALSVGTASYTLGGVTGSSLAAATTYTDYITASTTGKLIITPSSTSRFTISAISYKALTDATGDVDVMGNLRLYSPIQTPGGTDVITVGRTGDIGVGVAPVSGFKLAISGNTSTTTLTGVTYVSSGKVQPYGNADIQFADWAGTVVGVFDTSGSPSHTGNFGVGTTAPDKKVEINSATGANLRLTYDDSNGSAANYVDFAVSATGDLTVTPSGGDVKVAGTLSGSALITNKASGTTLTAAELNGVIRVTGTGTYVLPEAATLAVGTWVTFKAYGAVTITVDPNAADALEDPDNQGVYQTAGVTAVSSGSAGDTITYVYDNALQWTVYGRIGAWITGS